MEKFILAGLAPIWEVVFAPALGIALVVGMYGMAPTAWEPARDLAVARLRALRRSGSSLSKATATDVVGVLAAVLLAEPSRRARRDLAKEVLFALEEPLGAKIVSAGALAAQSPAYE